MATIATIAPPIVEAEPVIAPVVMQEPGAGGSYTRDPATGILTLVTPLTAQE